MSSPAHPSPVLRFGAFELDATRRELRKGGVLLKMHPQPFRVLLMLAERPGQIVTREEIRRSLWGDNTFVDFERGINFCVNQIRAALGDDADKPRFVETLPRHGYRFVASAESSAPRRLREALKQSAPSGRVYELPEDRERIGSSTPTVEEEATLSPRIPIASRKWWRILAVAGLVVIIAAGIGGYALHRRTSRAGEPNFESLRFTKLTSSGKAEDVAISPDGSYIVYSQRDRSGVGLWARHVASGSEVQILPSEEVDFRGLTFSPDGNSVFFVRTRKEVGTYKDLYVIPLLGGPSRLVAKDVDSPVSFSPDGRQLAYTEGKVLQDANEVHIANIDGSGNRVLTMISGTSHNFQPGTAWSPDGQTIAAPMMLRGDRQGFVLDAVSPADGNVREILWHAQVIGRPIWLPEGNTALVELDDSNGRGQLWMVSFPQGELRRVTNDLANWGIRIDATHNAKTVAAIQWSLVAHLWVIPGADPSKARQITGSGTPMIAAVAAPQERILAVSGNDELWSMSSDGTQSAPFSNLRDVSPPVVCGNYVVAISYSPGAGESPRRGEDGLKATKLASGRLVVQRSYQSGQGDMIRIDADGLNPIKLASGLLFSPSCSPDGKSLFYVSMGRPQKIFRMPIEGGDQTEIAQVPGETIRGTMRVSPDGKFLAFPYDENISKPVARLGVISINGGQLNRTLDAPAGIYRESCLRWSPNGKGLQYLLTKGDVTNIWEQPLSGREPRQVTHFTSGRIFDFNWSSDGQQLLVSRGEISSDVVLLSNSR
jgi:Tol biopolymer transport system component/DNA-binding winged helix-turn-helix (wHTH) protein